LRSAANAGSLRTSLRREPLARRHGAPRLRLIFVGFIFVGFLDDTTEKLAVTLVCEIEQFLFQFFIVYLHASPAVAGTCAQ
jgi:hypothetical protein